MAGSVEKRRQTIPGGCGNPDHALVLLPVSNNKSGSFRCNGCGTLDGGEVYHCGDCEYELCVRCESPAPPVIACADCQFDAHQACAEIDNEVNYFAHPEHSLRLLREYPYRDLPAGSAQCDACLESLKTSRWVYKCSAGCNYDVHALCAKHPVKLRHNAHSSHELSLKAVSGDNPPPPCEGCQKSVRGVYYQCDDCTYKLHPSCAILPNAPIHNGMQPMHRLTLHFKPVRSVYYLCVECGQRGSNWVYTCSTCDCNLHVTCAIDRHTRSMSHQRHLHVR